MNRAHKEAINEPESASAGKQFDWPLAFAAEKFLRQRIDGFLIRNSFAKQLAGKMRAGNGHGFLRMDRLPDSPRPG